MHISFIKVLLAAAVATTAVTATHAAETATQYPSRPIHVVVPFTAGSGSDTSARYYGEALGRLLGQPVIVDNRPGANGIIGLQYLKQQPADGYTILLASNSPISVNPVVLKNLPYDPMKDFKPISGLSKNMNAYLVAKDSPLKSVQDVIDYSKKTGKTLSVGTYSEGYHLSSAWFANLAGIRFTNIPYKGQSQIMNDVIGNQLDMAVVDLGGAWSLIRQGTVRALAVSGSERHPDFPKIPTIKESGYPTYVQYSWTSFYVHSETPDDITNKLADAMQKVLNTPESKAQLAQRGSQLMPYTPEQMVTLQKSELDRFTKVAAEAGIKAQ